MTEGSCRGQEGPDLVLQSDRWLGDQGLGWTRSNGVTPRNLGCDRDGRCAPAESRTGDGISETGRTGVREGHDSVVDVGVTTTDNLRAG